MAEIIDINKNKFNRMYCSCGSRLFFVQVSDDSNEENINIIAVFCSECGMEVKICSEI